MSKSFTMAYVPPQKRNIPKVVVKSFEAEFPELVKASCVPSKLNFKGLFKNVERKKRRAKPIPKGWIKLTKQGAFDSLTPEERNTEEEWKTYHQMKRNVDRMVERWDDHTEMRLERDGYLSDYSVEPPSENESSEESSEEELSEEENEILENDSKWFTA